MDAIERTLRPLLQPITRNLPAPLVSTGTQLLGAKCYTSLVDNIHVTDTDCLKLAVSKALGIGIIGASSIVKIPQLLKLLNSHSAEGISFLSYALETASYVISLAYNVRNGYDFSTYGEVALIAVQNVAISMLVLQYSGKGAAAAAFLPVLAAVGFSLYNDSITPMSTLQYLQAGAGVLGVASKVPQILTIFQQGRTGQLSAFAVSTFTDCQYVPMLTCYALVQVFNYLAGSLSRIFTTLQEVPDKLILYGFIAGFALNAVLAVQMLYYWNSPKTKATPQHKLEPSGKAAAKQAVGVDVVSKASSSEKARMTPSTRRRG